MRFIHPALLCSAALLAPAISPPAHGAVAHQQPAARCLALTTGPWSGPFHGSVAALHEVPRLARLDAKVLGPASSGLTRRVLEPPRRPRGNREPFPSSWTEDAEGLTLVWTDGFSGVHVRLRVMGDSLAGTAQAVHDMIDPNTPEPTAPVTGRIVRCAR